MKFIHTSDWHLGRQFHNVSLLDDQRVVLDQLVNYIRNHPVDAVVVAGDIFDRSVPPTAAIELLGKTIDEICGELDTPMILIPGNHDGAARLGFGASQMKPSGLHIISQFSQMIEPVVLKSERAGDVAFYGMPYSDPEQVRDAFGVSVSNYDEAHRVLVDEIRQHFDPKQRQVLLSHCFVDGAQSSESERPLSIGGSDRVSYEHFSIFDYVALGHLHQPQKRVEEHIRYSGSLMKYSFSEQFQKKGFTLVQLDENGFVCAEHIALDAPHDMRVIEGEMNDILEQGTQDPNYQDYLLVRLHDKHAILNPMEKLRVVYPNVLHLEKPGMLMNVEQGLSQAKLARSEVDMFRDFFAQAQDNPLSETQDAAICQLIQQLTKS
ncbi:exonuclease SbcCD subunit D [Vibrio vulnificus]|uniref:exonuclease SbcCD subunit D n=1 Tax=Vibrio vulnificus TaxID=672 RepID=UPI001A28B755|nr:exonuclease SbcCD subunit D [Vibrio vulnificus]EIV8465854.1 exonuclease SbcCD subunit D [Vibrio vulnificus]MCA3900675.1 exonuclease SbcCD subunit D [Vibrio vulnificus]MCA3904626.1 exonuclease SbcCD subunit D [Vibrio vulnificus]HAS8301845.1 exonuclease SbcCD subunit D [Vibrio vulnificus]